MKLLSYDPGHPVSADKILRTNISSIYKPSRNKSDRDSNFYHKLSLKLSLLTRYVISRKHHADDTVSMFQTKHITQLTNPSLSVSTLQVR